MNHSLNCFRSLQCIMVVDRFSITQCICIGLRFAIGSGLVYRSRLCFRITTHCFQKIFEKLPRCSSNAQPVNTRRRIQQTRTEWQLVRMRYNLNSTQEQRTKERKRRLVGYSFFFSLHLVTTQPAWRIILPELDKILNPFWIILPNC